LLIHIVKNTLFQTAYSAIFPTGFSIEIYLFYLHQHLIFLELAIVDFETFFVRDTKLVTVG